ncbi:hypothetical protein R3P38DRAFT_534646 [Favolaschia claudopus]|uniref:Uncharacterized protein n=1 Tax=Favolaschia claudopus TaxID=2862362 RepID=A0AAW0CIL7_9AGAR
MAPAIRDLLTEPFGPYPDNFLLNPDWKPKGKNLPQLENLRIKQEGKFIGLDICDRWVSPPTKPLGRVFFSGVLVIEDLSWLSEVGKTALTNEINERDVNWAGQRLSQNSKKTVQCRQLSLEGLYGRPPAGGFKVKVWIQAEKAKSAMFMTATDHPKSLLLQSKEPPDSPRNYEVIEMERNTYALSTNFLERYQLVAFIKDAAKKFDIPPNEAEATNLVDAYLKMHQENAWSYAAIFSDDPPRGKELAKIRLRLRHVSHDEVYNIFARHSTWLLAFYLSPRSRNCPLDVRSWCQFINKVRSAKRSMRSGNWGRSYEDSDIWTEGNKLDESHAAIATYLEKFGSTAEEWERKLDNTVTGKVSPTRDLTPDILILDHPARQPSVEYDSDFSELSTPGCSDSEDDFDPPPDQIHNILHYMNQPPDLIPGRLCWDCPIPKCNYTVDLRTLKNTGRESLPRAIVRKKQFTSLNDAQVQMFLMRSMSDHFCKDHFHIQKVKLHKDKEKFFHEFLQGN